METYFSLELENMGRVVGLVGKGDLVLDIICES